LATFVLIHGAWHGAWCWERLIPELEARGHQAVAVDLPCEDPAAGTSEYADVVLGSLDDLGDELVVVGHSLGGLTAPLVAARRPTRRLVLLTPGIPKPGHSLIEALELEPYNQEVVFGEEVGEGFLAFPASMIDVICNACEPADARWAAGKLRLQSVTPFSEPCPIERMPPVPTTVVLGTLDRALDVGRMSAIVRDRLDVEPILIRSDHSPFLSMPGELADLLVGLA
jgi:pimeloyl-ACP methyl ester carboxylesterase